MRSWGPVGKDLDEGRIGLSRLSRPSCLKIAAMRRALPIALAVALAAAIAIPRAQMRVAPVDVLQGHVALGLALRHLANVGIVMKPPRIPTTKTTACS